jgi:hypothetical protein
MDVFVLIADMIKSKEIEDRNTFQKEMERCLEDVSKSSDSILSPYTITLGDEFQAVYKSGKDIIKDISFILTKVHPVQIRFAVSFDKINTDINREKSIGMDGPAFHAARNGLNGLKKINYSIIQFYGISFDDKDIVNTSLNLAMSIMADWKKNTMVIFNELLRHKPVKKIVPLLDITERGIYKHINTQKLRNFIDLFTSVEGKICKLKG